MNRRLKSIRKYLKTQRLDGVFFTFSHNISYLTGTHSRDSYFLITKNASFYITDSRYVAEAKSELKGSRVVKLQGPLAKTLLSCCKNAGIKRLGFEDRRLSVESFNQLKIALSKIELVPLSRFTEKLRMVKDPAELNKMFLAVRITKEALGFAQKVIREGMTELELAGEIERFIRYKGAEGASFDIIVASGPNASYPHHLTSDRCIRKNEPVIIDMGVEIAGYKSDLTRVLFLGKLKTSVQRAYNIVKKAQDTAIKAIKPGKPASEIDRIGRAYIKRRGFGRYFGHALGHGVGLEIHEAPSISEKDNTVLKPGMVFTIEPGIYLPGRFGIRLEEMVLVTRKGSKVL